MGRVRVQSVLCRRPSNGVGAPSATLATERKNNCVAPEEAAIVYPFRAAELNGPVRVPHNERQVGSVRCINSGTISLAFRAEHLKMTHAVTLKTFPVRTKLFHTRECRSTM